MYFTVSRIGLVAFLLVCAYLFYRMTVYGIRWLQDRLKKHSANIQWHLDKWFPIVFVLAVFAVFVGAAIGLVVILAHYDPRTARLLSLQAMPTDIYDFALRVNFAERVVYWSIGWNVFSLHPILGVGLGNTGFFFSQFMPNISYRLAEIVTLVNNASDLPNIKSFWLRLLAETGLVGTSVFIAWQYVLWHAGKFLRANRSILLRTIGWMGAIAVIAFLAEGFSIDSFALPYLWVSMGLLTAASAMARREKI